MYFKEFELNGCFWRQRWFRQPAVDQHRFSGKDDEGTAFGGVSDAKPISEELFSSYISSALTAP